MYKKIAHIQRVVVTWSFLIVPLVIQVIIGSVAFAQEPPADGGGEGGSGGVGEPAAPAATRSDLENLVNNIAQFGAAGVGIVVVAMMAWAGFRYLSAGDNASQVAEAKNQIFQALIALFLYIFALAILNWLIPGGLIGGGEGGGGGEGAPDPANPGAPQ